MRMRSPFTVPQHLASRQQRGHEGSSNSIAYMHSPVLAMLVISLIAKDAAHSSMAWLAILLLLVGSPILPAPLSPSTRPLRHHPCLGTSHLLMSGHKHTTETTCDRQSPINLRSSFRASRCHKRLSYNRTLLGFVITETIELLRAARKTWSARE